MGDKSYFVEKCYNKFYTEYVFKKKWIFKTGVKSFCLINIRQKSRLSNKKELKRMRKFSEKETSYTNHFL